MDSNGVHSASPTENEFVHRGSKSASEALFIFEKECSGSHIQIGAERNHLDTVLEIAHSTSPPSKQ